MTANKPPHILIFNPDQWRGDVLGHMGNPAAVTPVLDDLVAGEAVSFRRAFCQNPVCTPSRCSFMTGLYPHVRGHRTMYHMLHAEHGETNLLKLLKDSGYYVWWGGKNDLLPGQTPSAAHTDMRAWHNGEALHRRGLTARRDRHNVDDWRGPPGGDNYYSFYCGRLDKGDEPIYGDNDWANILAAMDFVQNYRGDKPLCIFLSLGYPHPPYGVEEPFYSMIDRAKLPGRTSPPDGWAGKPSILGGIAEGQGMGGWSEERWTELRAVYYGMCTRVDHQLGLLIDAMKQAGMWDDTAMFMFADHGDFTGDYGLVEKTQNTFEDCLTRVPFVVKPPRGVDVKPRVSEAIVELVDFPATVFELAGINPGYTHFGRSLLDVLAGRTDEHRDAAFCEGGRLAGEESAMEKQSTSSCRPSGLYYPRIRLQAIDEPPYHTKAAMCRMKEFKYVRRLYEGDELYDLATDPQERCNVIDRPEHAQTLATLKDRMLRWYQETCDTVPWQADRR